MTIGAILNHWIERCCDGEKHDGLSLMVETLVLFHVRYRESRLREIDRWMTFLLGHPSALHRHQGY
jgi:hypothetical protein